MLTAIEDFLNETPHELEMLEVPGFCMLGILIRAQLKRDCPKLTEVLAAIELPEPMRRYVQELEEARMRVATELAVYRAALRRLTAEKMQQATRGTQVYAKPS